MLSHGRAMHRSLVGGTVQRVDLARVGARDLALMRIRVPGETGHIVIDGVLGVAIVDSAERDRLRAILGGSRSPVQAQWRACLQGAKMTGIGDRRLDFARDGAIRQVFAASGTLRLEQTAAGIDPTQDPSVLAPGTTPGLPHGKADRPTSTDRSGAIDAPSGAPMTGGAHWIDELDRLGTLRRLDALRQRLSRARARVERRIAAVQGDLAKLQAAQAAARHAPLFVAEAARAPRGATVLRAVDWSSGQPRTLEMPIDPTQGARQHVEALFTRSRRLKDAAHIPRARLEQAERIRDALAAIALRIGRPDEDPDALEAEARTAAPRDFNPGPLAAIAQEQRIGGAPRGPTAVPPGARAGKGMGRPCYRTFQSASGKPIYVGRGAAHNDRLTLHVARPHDLWLHARSQAGAHVVVPLDKGASCPADVLVEAAHLAAHFSEAREERVVEVQYAPRRHVRKPRGSLPGAVVVDREKVLVLRKNDEVLRHVLEREA
jgi:ribosomal quality control pathway NFACT family protein